MILECPQLQSGKVEQMLPLLLTHFQDVFGGGTRMRDLMGQVHRHVDCRESTDEGDMDLEDCDLFRRFFLCRMALVGVEIHRLYSKQKGLRRPRGRPIDESSIIR